MRGNGCSVPILITQNWAIQNKRPAAVKIDAAAWICFWSIQQLMLYFYSFNPGNLTNFDHSEIFL